MDGGGFDLSSMGLGMMSAAANFIGGLNKLDRETAAFNEQIRRANLGEDQKEASTLAAGSAGSGVDVGSRSLQNYLSAMSGEYRKERDWAGTDFGNALKDQTASTYLGAFMDFGKAMFGAGQGSGGLSGLRSSAGNSGSSGFGSFGFGG